MKIDFEQERKITKKLTDTVCAILDNMLEDRILSETENNDHIEIGENVRLLILSDCLPKTASALKNFIDTHSDATVLDVISSVEEALQIASGEGFDLFIMVGLLHDESNLGKLEELKNKNPGQKSIMWTCMDDVAAHFCGKYQIDYLIADTESADCFTRTLQYISYEQNPLSMFD